MKTALLAQSDIRRKSGFTLIELMIALFLLTAAIYIFLKFTDTFGKIGRSRNLIKAYHVAEKKMEELRNTPFENLPSSGAFTDGTSQGQITIGNYQAQTDIKEVKVEVTYTDQYAQKQVRIDTLMSKWGLNP